MFKNIKFIIKQWMLKYNYRIAVKEANRRKNHSGKKQCVIKWQGGFAVVEYQRLKQLHSEGKFKTGLNFRELKQHVLYSTI